MRRGHVKNDTNLLLFIKGERCLREQFDSITKISMKALEKTWWVFWSFNMKTGGESCNAVTISLLEKPSFVGWTNNSPGSTKKQGLKIICSPGLKVQRDYVIFSPGSIYVRRVRTPGIFSPGWYHQSGLYISLPHPTSGCFPTSLSLSRPRDPRLYLSISICSLVLPRSSFSSLTHLLSLSISLAEVGQEKW